MAWFRCGGGGGDVSGVTAIASDVVSPKKFVNSQGILTTGTLVLNDMAPTEVVLTASNPSFTINAGNYKVSGGNKVIKVPVFTWG